MTSQLQNGAAFHDTPPDPPESTGAPQETTPLAAPESVIAAPRRSWWRSLIALPGRIAHARLFRSRWVRLILGLGVLAVVLGIVAFGILRVLGARDKIAPLTLPFVEEFTAVEVSKWLTRDGVWTLRQDALAQLANLEKAAQLFLPAKIAADQPYHLSTYVIFGGSTRAAGVNFNAQYPALTTQTHQVVIRRTEAPAAEDGALPPPAMELVAGYTDESGAFVPQVTAPFDLDTVEYRLDVYVLGNSYTVQLNGQTLIERRPLFYGNGLVGFVSEGPARFDALRITTAQTRDPGEQVYVSDFTQTPGGAGWVPLSGEWEVSDGELVQADPAAQDAAIGYEGSAFENYVVQTTFRHLVGVGGGLLFNMASPYQTNGAYIVRYSEQTDSVFWGFFDEAGLFTRQGYMETPPAATAPHTLAVYAGVESYDVYLDEQLLARNVPFQGATPATEEGRSGGHIGLITSRSSVAYSTVEVFPLFDNSQIKLPKPQQVTAATAITTAAETTAETVVETTAETAVTPPAPATASATDAPPADAPQATATPTLRPATPAPTLRTTTALPADSSLIQPGTTGWRAAFRGDLGSAGWRPLNGEWAFSNDALVQSDPTGIDVAIVYTGSAFQEYSYSAALTHREGNAGGLLFNMPYTDRLAGAHMVRYSERRPGGIFWGYFDETGKFVGQGYANVDPPADARHTLRVVSGAETYSLYLDDFLLAADLPLRQNYGYVGLATVQSTASFDQVEVGAALVETVQTPVARPALSAAGLYTSTLDLPDRRVISGQWETEGDTYRQTAPDPADYVLNTGLYAANYQVEADVLLPVKPEIGAGFMVHMLERGRKNGATVVRFTDGGDGLFWGVYDAAGVFVGRGSVDLANKAEGDNLYHLAVAVRGDTLDIRVDDEVVVSGIVLPRTEGWIGLVTHGGPVTFNRLQITVEDGE